MHAVVVAWVYYINQTRGVLYSSICSDLSPARDVNTLERVFSGLVQCIRPRDGGFKLFDDLSDHGTSANGAGGRKVPIQAELWQHRRPAQKSLEGRYLVYMV